MPHYHNMTNMNNLSNMNMIHTHMPGSVNNMNNLTSVNNINNMNISNNTINNINSNLPGGMSNGPGSANPGKGMPGTASPHGSNSGMGFSPNQPGSLGAGPGGHHNSMNITMCPQYAMNYNCGNNGHLPYANNFGAACQPYAANHDGRNPTSAPILGAAPSE